MEARLLPWWMRERMLTPKDREAIARAERTDWPQISEDWAETEAGRVELHNIIMRKYHYEEYCAGML